MSAPSVRSSAMPTSAASSASRAAALSELLRASLTLVPEPPGPPPPDGDEALFRAACRDRCVHSLRLVCLVTIACALIWWPTDPFIYRQARSGLGPVLFMRASLVMVPLAVLLLLRLPRLRPHALVLFTAAISVCSAALGYYAGLMGRLDEPWFSFLLVGLYIPVLMPLPPGRRVALTLAIAAGLWSGLLVPFPGNLSSAFLPLNLSVQLNIFLLSLVFGHGLFVLNRHIFMQSRVIHRDAEQLKGYSAQLEARVAERTTDLRRLLAHVETAREQERTRVSRELHDELGQELAVLGYEAEALQRRCAEVTPGLAGPAGLADKVEDLAAQLEHARGTLRALVTDLRPRVIDDLGLCAAVQWLVERTEDRSGLRCALALSGEGVAVPDEVAIAAFRIVQESLTNVLRHAAASAVDVSVSITPGALDLRVRDDGAGVSAERLAAATGVGLLGMRERALCLGGEVLIDSAPGAGTEIRCHLSWPAA
jgi:signal transduction histidine kinase